MAWTLITGGATRLGREIALAFAQAGWGIVCHYRASQDAAQALCDTIRQQGGEALAVQGELEDESSCRAFFDATVQTTGAQLRCVVNNASLFEPDTGTTMQMPGARQQLEVNQIGRAHV